jgi:hypothetical protein
MVDRLARNEKCCLQPDRLVRLVCDQLRHVRFCLVLSFHPRSLLKHMLSLTSLIHFNVNSCSASWSIKCSSSLRAQTTNCTCSRPPVWMSRNDSKMGYHGRRAACLHEDTCRRLLRSRAAICPSPLPHYPPLDSLTQAGSLPPRTDIQHTNTNSDMTDCSTLPRSQHSPLHWTRSPQRCLTQQCSIPTHSFELDTVLVAGSPPLFLYLSGYSSAAGLATCTLGSIYMRPHFHVW